MSNTALGNLDTFKTKFQNHILPQWQSFKSKLGQFLLEAQNELTDTYYKTLRLWLKDHHHIAYSMQDVAIRVAKGEMTDEQASLIPASIAKNISVQNMPIPDQEYEIYSPDVGGVIKKKFRDFSPAEKKVNVTSHGIRIEENPTEGHKPFIRAKASSFRIEKDELIVVMNSIKKEVSLPITSELITAITSCQKSKRKGS